MNDIPPAQRLVGGWKWDHPRRFRLSQKTSCLPWRTGEVSGASIGTPLLADIIVHVEKAFLQELENEKGVRTAVPWSGWWRRISTVQNAMRDTVAHFLAKTKKVSQKELRMTQNINALLLCFAEQHEVMKNEIIQTGRFGLDGKV